MHSCELLVVPAPNYYCFQSCWGQ